MVERAGRPARRTDEVRIGVAYATRTYRREPHYLDGDGGTMVGATVANPRHGIMLAFEEDRWLVGLAGYSGDDPPLDPDGVVAAGQTRADPSFQPRPGDARPDQAAGCPAHDVAVVAPAELLLRVTVLCALRDQLVGQALEQLLKAAPVRDHRIDPPDALPHTAQALTGRLHLMTIHPVVAGRNHGGAALLK